MPTPLPPETKVDPRRYFESAEERRGDYAARLPVCVYLETTNRCNLLCTTCPRTYAELEPPADMSWKLFVSIVDQIPNLQRAVLHGVGEPMLVRNLPRMVPYLKDRGTYVLFNTNGTLLNERNGRALIDGRPGRASRFARCRKCQILSGRPRQGLFRPHPAERARLSQSAGPGRRRIGRASRLGSPGSRRRLPSCRPSSSWRRRSASRGLSAAPGILRRTTPSALPGPTKRSTSK